MGAAWFAREQWERLRAVASDPGNLEESYDDWCTMAERSIREFESEGMRIEQVPIDVEDLVAWCAERNRPIDSAARAAFAADMVRRRHLRE